MLLSSCTDQISTGHCCSIETENEQSNVVCLAVIRENGLELDVIDSNGKSRAFALESSNNNNFNIKSSSGTIDPNCGKQQQKLCFSTHGAGNGADGLLTPCFDEHGQHGSSEEGCFCGVDEAHLHAHAHDPKKCLDNGVGGETFHGGNKETNLAFLAKLTLYPMDDVDNRPLLHDEDSNSSSQFKSTNELEIQEEHKQIHSISIPISENLPKQCNSKYLSRKLNEINLSESSLRKRKMLQVKHDDHFDYLVRNDNGTGDLHLEHECLDCGSNDYHGKFNFVSERKWISEKSSNSKNPKQSHDAGFQLHFFEVSPKPFHILDLLTDMNLFVPSTTDRVAVVKNLPCCATQCCSNEQRKTCSIPKKSCMKLCCDNSSFDYDNIRLEKEDILSADFAMTNSNLGKTSSLINSKGKSQIFIEKICCSAEIPIIKDILVSIDGIFLVAVNSTNKIVYVDHDVNKVTADFIAGILNKEKFGARVIHDAYKSMTRKLPSYMTKLVSSEFQLMCNNVETLSKNPINDMLHSLPQNHVGKHSIDLLTNIVTIEHKPFYLTATKMKSLLDEYGMKCKIIVNGADDSLWAFPIMETDSTNILNNHMSHPSIFIILSGFCWLISMLSIIGGNWAHLRFCGLISVLFGIPPIAQKAFRTLYSVRFDSNCMMFFAAIGAVALGEFAEAAAVTFLFGISEWLESRATSRARNALLGISSLRPDKANLISPISEEIIIVPADCVTIGATVSVRPGDKVPCDGIIIEGVSTLDESSLTGESRPIRKGLNDPVSGGTINCGMAQLLVKITSTADNSAVARLIHLVEDAQLNPSRVEKIIDEFANRFTPLVVFVAICMLTLPWIFGHEEGREWTMKALMTIVVACPCAIIISTPVVYVAGIAACAQKGIVIKGGSILEYLGKVKKVTFDKTGTLTRGVFRLLRFRTIGCNFSLNEVWQYLLMMERSASHPLANALVNAAKSEGVHVPTNISIKNHTTLQGEGVTASINGKPVYVGNLCLFKRLNLYDKLDESIKEEVDKWTSLGGTIGFISVGDDGIIGAYCVADEVRKESKAVVSTLLGMGIDVNMLTGDDKDAAHAIGYQVGLTQNKIQSNQLPIDKLENIKCAKEELQIIFSKSILSDWLLSLHYRNTILMCGDGLNDAPALALADIGVAIGAGAALVMETSDITLLDSNLNKLLLCIHIGRRVEKKILQNISFSLISKIIVMLLILFKKGTLWLAIVSDVGAMLIVTLNAMRLLPSKNKLDNAVKELPSPEEAISV